MGTGINIGSRIEFKLSKDTEVNTDQSLKLNHKVGDRIHSHNQVQSH